jgi:hypothetical protein
MSARPISTGQGTARQAPRPAPTKGRPAAPRLTSDQVWHALTKASFAVLSHNTPAGEPRSSGVVYTTVDRRMYVAVAKDSWKARHIAASGQVAVTVPVRRGGIVSLLLPIPPATISFHASATVHPGDALHGSPLLDRLAPLLPAERRVSSCIIEVRPVGHFVTYGVGVPLRQMRDTVLARARVPVS